MLRFDDLGIAERLSTMAYGDVSDAETHPHLLASIDSVSGTATAASGLEKQDSSPWRSLPSDILDQALALLPLPDVFRVRSVCKRWNSVIHCAQFQELSLRSSVSWGPFYSPRVGWKGQGSRSVLWSSYDLSEGKWITMPQFEFPVCAQSSSWNLLAANGGLFCFGASDGPRRILVCNPMTKTWRELPSVNMDYSARVVMVTHMIVDELRSSYKILFAGTATVDLYDSVTNKWNAAEKLSAGLSFRSGAYCNGEIYLLTKLLSSGLYSVMILDLTNLRWKESTILIPPSFAKYPYIVACSGQVYLVGGSSETTDTMPMGSIGLFQLDPSGRWNKVSEYSNHAFLRSTGAIYGCGAHGGKIYVVTYAYDMWVAVYNCASGFWEEPIKGNFFDMKDIFETKFAFQPNLRVAP
ncbi:hypothetical protein M758_7G079300 [Ceratodon purpureus]|nr:hypothetical protein M758_7G079300 [Ceratodon purpureus]